MPVHPYRELQPHRAPRSRGAGDPDVGIIYMLAFLLGSIRLAVAFAMGETLGAEAAVAAIFVAAAMLGWLLDR